jgi:hypothetical protein
MGKGRQLFLGGSLTANRTHVANPLCLPSSVQTVVTQRIGIIGASYFFSQSLVHHATHFQTLSCYQLSILLRNILLHV